MVQVCDVCGDCGQEVLLATCCRCNDGAEHIYCMREMLDTVPDGDWMCEECKYMELVTNKKSQMIRRVDENSCVSVSHFVDTQEIWKFGHLEPMVKLEDQVVLPRQILMREHISFALLEGVTRSDVRCTLQQSSSQHYISPKTSCSSTPRVDKKPASSCESSPLTIITNHHELSFNTIRSIFSNEGEFAGPSSHAHSTLVVFSTLGTESTELKSKQANPKEEEISCSIVSETPPLSQSLSNGLSHSRDFASSGVGMVEYSGNYFQEDNVALFFFAKDVESYDKVYKLLLENMMKNDLALKGNFNGVELLIFPSNQLPDNSQRWNTLFFLWGMFRGEKQSCSQHIPEPLEQFISSQDIPPAILSLPPNRCSLRPITGHLPVSQLTAPTPDVLTAAELCSLLSSRTLNGEFSPKYSPSDHPDDVHFSSPKVAVRSDNAKQCQGLEHYESDIALLELAWQCDDRYALDCRHEFQLQTPSTG